MNQKLVSILGWYGAAAILVAYGLVTLAGLKSASWAYLLLNLTGSACLVIEARSKKDSPLVALNAVWIVIAVIGLAQLYHG